MQLFADTSDPGVLKELRDLGLISGATTNPSTASKYIRENNRGIRTVRDLARAIYDAVGPIPVSIEAVGCIPPDYSWERITADRLYQEGERIISWNEEWGANFWQKMPTIPQGLEATWRLVRDFGDKAKINATLGFSYKQGIRAAQAGAHVYSLFIGRMEAANQCEGFDVTKDLIDTYAAEGIATGFLAASMRTPEQILTSWELWADIATSPPDKIKELIKKYPDEFEKMIGSHPPKRQRKLHFLPDPTDAHPSGRMYGTGEFKHPLLDPGGIDFVSAAEKAQYDLFAEQIAA